MVIMRGPSSAEPLLELSHSSPYPGIVRNCSEPTVLEPHMIPTMCDDPDNSSASEVGIDDGDRPN